MRTRREEDALDLRRLRNRLSTVIGEAVDVAGQDGRLFPALKPSIAALRCATPWPIWKATSTGCSPTSTRTLNLNRRSGTRRRLRSEKPCPPP